VFAGGDWRRIGGLLVLGIGLLALPGRALAQSPAEGSPSWGEAFVLTCLQAYPGAGEGCRTGALSLHALAGGIGLGMGAGGPFPVSPNILGQRVYGMPRLLFDLGMTGASFSQPDLTDPGAPAVRRWMGAPRFSVGVGVFEGFSPLPTVGGVGGVDLIGEVRSLPFPGFSGVDRSVWALGLGGRVGIFRESFSLPGLSVTAMHRRAGRVDQAVPVEGESGTELSIQPRTTSLRAVLGKDLWEVGVSGGFQQDWIRGTGSFQRSALGLGPPEADGGATGSVRADRSTWFLGFNWTWVVTQATLELGWSPTPAVPAGLGPGFEEGLPGGLAAALSFRLLY